MRVYEKYFARQIYLAFLFVLLAFVGLFVFFDLVSELGDVGRGGYRFQHALAYVLLFAPQRMYEIIPVASLIAAIYVCAQLAGNSEFTIFRVSGLSTGQALRSLLKIGFPVVLITFVIGEYIAPNAEQLAQKIRLEALGSSVSAGFRSGVWVKDTVDQDGQRVTRFINVGTLNPDNSIANVRIYEFDDKLRLDSVRLAKLGQFDAPNFWKLTDVSETVFTATADATTSSDPLRALVQSKQVHIDSVQMRSELTPQILSVLMVSPDNMAIGSLYRYIGHLKENQQNTDRYNLALWQKLLYPFAVFVMMALALPFAYLHARAGAIGLKVFGGIMLGMSFQLLNNLFSHLGLLNTWPAWFTAALPSLLYLVLAIGALRWVDKH
ncbi:Lipopolysaccharide export system permease protein LptG [Pandoraea captiosa]|uniref:Lipopolysaccharide export system permease protein LptG n=1 Tax=Pandoraea captiosa TaxID=2508302 RepID=A0A5E5AAK2_9BURK|nr:LPS export ABC transporter permease LptG [Pandoraea captiosa]VVE69533.1 Lipopolysaccharide export system permease protein LptG [Pandoraea captiosa]